MKKIISVIWIAMLFAFAPSHNMKKVIDHAKWQATQHVTYDGTYVQIKYPNGDVPANKGVCTDVIIRAYRAIDIDLQVLVHKDIISNAYNLKKIDSNIDHRRCTVLRKFFKRQDAQLKINDTYNPGDIVFWAVAAGHVGIVTDIKVPGTDRYYVCHNIGAGPKVEDFLYGAKIVDHYRWTK
jgi:uncharacterized protein YijF (DUF1287 family)